MIRVQNEIFESFNARFLEPAQVGERFVFSPFLERIVAPVNTAVLGPRGSGKTTLLKMLTVSALRKWHGQHSDEILSEIDYLSVYIPYSVTWSADYRGFSTREMQPEIRELLNISLFRHNFLISLLDTWLDASSNALANHKLLSKFHLPIDRSREAQLVRQLSHAWEIDIPISTINGLKQGITTRIRILQRLSVTAARSIVSIEKWVADYDFLAAHFLDDAAVFADFLAEHYSFKRKIALCFDELEVATEAIAEAILRSPRSIDQRFLVKFSTAPYVGVASTIDDPTVPTQVNDYELIFLSSFSSGETYRFSEALFRAICRNRDIDANPSDVLGPSFLQEAIEPSSADATELKSKYGPDSSYREKFESLFDRDPSFRAYVAQKPGRSTIAHLIQGSENERAAQVRKIIWPVLVREEFLFKQEAPSRAERPRRRLRTVSPVSDIYTGAVSLFAICEGNPRSIIGLMDPMAEAYAEQFSKGTPRSVRRSLQKDLVESLIAAYFALISTVPSGASSEGLSSLLDVVFRVGNYFKASILGPQFNPDPVLSFIVDDKLSQPIRELVGKGINIGAFITTNEKHIGGIASRGISPYRLGDIVGLKVRLSNIFAPYFRLPLIGGRTINLSTLLARGERTPSSAPLLELFGEKI